MSVEILGRREDLKLELKSRDALDDPGKIAREVVGMLNAEGGEVWIGVAEDDGKAVAVDAVADPERAKDRLWDYLLETVEPSPIAPEVTIDLAPPASDPALLVVKVQPPPVETGRRPFAFRRKGGWHFVRRVGARNHPMSRQELFGRAVRRGDDPEVEKAIRELVEARKRQMESGAGGLWVGLQPAEHLDLDPEDELFTRIVEDPAVTGNRRSGWHFAQSHLPPTPIRDGLEWGLGSPSSPNRAFQVEEAPSGAKRGWFVPANRDASRVEVTHKGRLQFWVAFERILDRHAGQDELHPIALLEIAISAFRIARTIYKDLNEEIPVASDLSLLGIGGWGLRVGSPGDYAGGRPLVRQEEPDLIWEPMVFRFGEIDEAPDRCGFRLVRRVYHAFGFRESDMPQQYHRESGRLILPE